MSMIIVSFLVLLLIVAGMSIGVLFGRRPISGSCGGVGAALGEKDYTCEICGGDEAKCEQVQADQKAKPQTADLAYNAVEKKSKG